MTENAIDNLLRRLVTVTGITTQIELSEVLGINRSAISHARQKNKIPDKWILRLYRTFNLNPEWVESGVGRTFINKSSMSDVGFTYVPKVNAILSAGGGSFEVSSQVDEHVPFISKWLRKKGSIQTMIVMDVTGESMEPVIMDGDMVLIDRAQKEISNRKIYAIRIDDAIYIKRLEQHPNRLVLTSENNAYAPIYINENEINNTQIIGKVLWSSREYK